MKRALPGLFAVALAACAAPPAGAPAHSVPKPAPEARETVPPPKSGAPVSVSSSVAGDRVHLELAFAAAGDDVSVSLRGVGGLSVLGETEPLQGRSVGAGETLVLDVAVAPGPGQSDLAVFVSGEFGGVRAARAASVSFGSLDRERVRAATRADDGQGRPMKVGRGVIR